MGDYLGDAEMIALQRAIRNRLDEISANPLLANGGRVLNILDPDTFGWDQVKRVAARDGVIALTMVDRDKTLSRLADEFGPDAQFPYWEAFTGTPDQVLPPCREIVTNCMLPSGWTIRHETKPDDFSVDQAQRLNSQTGVAPVPAYYLKGEHVPAILTCLWDETGELAGCASATMRYHPESPMSGWLFAGSVSIAPKHRGKGLGLFVNAALLIESYAHFGWVSVLEQARASNAASVAMIKRCGMMEDPAKVTIGVITNGKYFTR